MTGTWKITLPCSKADADALPDDIPLFADLDPAPSLVTSEPDPAHPERMELAVYVEGEPDPAFVAALSDMLPTSPRAEPIIELLPDEDWVTLSQQGLDPVEAGRFVVHTAADRDQVPVGRIGIQVEASRAFGTGHHPTTAGCLRAIDALETAPSNVLDLGCGTALLAIAVAKAFPQADIAASDIDAPSIDIARETLEANDVPENAVQLFVADGLAAAPLEARSPYDLILANILAGPLVELAPDVVAALADGGRLVLAGLLAEQEDGVTAAYEALGLELKSSDPNVGWPVLTLSKPA